MASWTAPDCTELREGVHILRRVGEEFGAGDPHM